MHKRFLQLNWVYIVCVVCFLVAVYLQYKPVLSSKAQYDDAYITYRYAVNFAEGKGLVFNSYEKINNASSLLYTVILALIYKLGIHDLESVSIVLGLLCAVLIFYLLVEALQKLNKSSALTIALVVPISISGALTGWAVSGMETVFYTLAILAFAVSYMKRSYWLSAIIMGICILLRIESVTLLFAVFITEIGFYLVSEKINWRVILVGGFACLVVLIMNYVYYKELIPHPLLFKHVASYYARLPETQAKTIFSFYLNEHLVPFVLSIVFVILTISRLTVFPILSFKLEKYHIALSIYVVVSFVSFIYGPYSDLQRYTVHIVPILIILAAAVFRPTQKVISLYKRWFSFGIFTIIFVYSLNSSYQGLVRTSITFNSWTEHQIARRKLGEWMVNNIPIGDKIISSDIGMIAYVAKEYDFVDVLGLTSTNSVEAVRSVDWQRVSNSLNQIRPLWISDTVIPSGEIQSIDILERPDKYFKIPYQGIWGLEFNVLDGTGLTVPVENYNFIVRKLDWQ